MAVNSLCSRGRPEWRAHVLVLVKGLPHRETGDGQARCAAEGECWNREAYRCHGDQRGGRDQGSNPAMTYLKNACAATNSLVPPSVSAAEASVLCTPGCAPISTSAATATIPAIVGTWE
jgi:hypothetical protein